MEHESLGSRLAYALALREMSGRRLAEKVGVSSSIISKTINGKQGAPACLPEIAEVLGVRLAWLARGAGPVTEFSERGRMSDPGSDSQVMLYRWIDPRCRFGPRYGDGEAQEFPPIAIARAVLDRQNLEETTCFGDQAPDDSMADGILTGDDLCIDTEQRDPTVAPPRAVFAIRFGKRLIYRRVSVSVLGDVTLVCTSADKLAFPDQHVPASRASDVEIVGRMVYSGGDK